MNTKIWVAALAALTVVSYAKADVELYENGNYLGSVEIPKPEQGRPYTYKCYRRDARLDEEASDFFKEHNDQATSARIRHSGGPCRILFFERESGSKDENWIEVNLHADCPDGTTDISFGKPGGNMRFPVINADGTVVGDAFYHDQQGEPVFHDLSRIEIYRYR